MAFIGARRFTMGVAAGLVMAAQALAVSPPWLNSGSITVADADGNLYVAGSVSTDSVPATAGAFQTAFNAGTCGYTSTGSPSRPPIQFIPIPCTHIFVAKLSADRSTVLYATYLEGSGNDLADHIAVDAEGRLFIAGQTTSPDFPIDRQLDGLPGPGSAGWTLFVAELSADGSELAWGAKFGGAYYTTLAGMRLDSAGGLYCAGTTDGTAFGTTPGAYLGARPNASLDGYLFKVDTRTQSLVFSTLFGGSDQDLVTGLAIDAQGNPYITGYTISQDFPLTPGSFQSPGRRVNAFVAKLDSTGSSLLFSSWFGGAYNDVPIGIEVDRADAAYIAGMAQSPDLPVSPGTAQTDKAASFIGKFDGSTGARLYLTYLAGDASRLAPAPDGSVWISGQATDPARAVGDPLAPCYYTDHVWRLSADGARLINQTYVNGSVLTLNGTGAAIVATGEAGLWTPEDLTAPPGVACVVNAASLARVPIAPGEIVSIFGPSFESGLSGELEVFIGGRPALILYASQHQINAVAPYDGPAQGDVRVEVRRGGLAVGASVMQAVAAAPAIFTHGGPDRALALNSDGTWNAPDNPSKPASTVSIFVTGLGSRSPVGGTVSVIASDAALLVTYAGLAPGWPEGVQRLDVQRPASAGAVLIYIQVSVGLDKYFGANAVWLY